MDNNEQKKKGGRPKGSVNKYTGKEIIQKYNVISSSDFLVDLLRDMITAREAGDRRTLVAYQTLLAKFVFTEVDPETSKVQAPNLTYEEMVQAAKLAIAAAEQKEKNDTNQDSTGTTSSGS